MAGTVLTLLVLVVVFGPGAEWVLHYIDGIRYRDLKPSASQSPAAQWMSALDAVRGRAIALGTGLLAAVAIFFTARTAEAAQRNAAAQARNAEAQALNAAAQARSAESQAHNAEAAHRTADATVQGLVTGRYTAAIGQLGSTEVDVRMGGIYALERIATDSERDDPVITEVLTAFFREHLNDDDARMPLFDEDDSEELHRLRADLRAALAVLGRRVHDNDIRPDLSVLYLSGLNLAGITLRRTNLHYTELRGTDLSNADLEGTDLSYAYLSEANLFRANMDRTDLHEANLSNVDLRNAHLVGARMYRVDLSGANLRVTNLANARLDNANFTRAVLQGGGLPHATAADANFTDADLTGVILDGAGLTNANLTGARLQGASVVGTDLRGVVGVSEEEVRTVARTDAETRFSPNPNP